VVINSGFVISRMRGRSSRSRVERWTLWGGKIGLV